MESSAVLRSLHCSVNPVSHAQCTLEKPGKIPMQNRSCLISRNLPIQGLKVGPVGRNVTTISCAKTSEAIVPSESDVSLESATQGSKQKSMLPRATFPSGFEALLLEICDETEIAELKLKIGDFEMHLKRNVGATVAPLSNISPTIPPPIPTKPMIESAPVVLTPPAPKLSPEKSAPFINASFGKSSKLAALEASGANSYVLVASPTVGSFRTNRTVKGKKQPPICKEGDVIKEGQVIGYLDQFGTELPVKVDNLYLLHGILIENHNTKSHMGVYRFRKMITATNDNKK